MKTFFGFTTGLLTGAILGVIAMAAGILLDDDLREFTNKQAEDLKN